MALSPTPYANVDWTLKHLYQTRIAPLGIPVPTPFPSNQEYLKQVPKIQHNAPGIQKLQNPDLGSLQGTDTETRT